MIDRRAARLERHALKRRARAFWKKRSQELREGRIGKPNTNKARLALHHASGAR